MKNIKYLLSVIFIASMTFIMSCEEEGDTVAPTITITAPTIEEVLYIGSEIHFEVDFADNVELKSYKVDIHSNFDGHNHKSTTEDSIAWSYQHSWDFEAGMKNSHIHHHEIVIPHDINGVEIAKGDYHFMVYCTDAAGNESWSAVNVEIQKSNDTEAPEFININAPTSGQIFTTNDVITISGTVTENEHLEGLFVAIMPAGATNEMVNSTDCFAVMLHEHDAVHELSTYNFTTSITVGQAQDNNNPPKNITWTPGNYFIIIKALDESGNIGFSTQYPIVIQ